MIIKKIACFSIISAIILNSGLFAFANETENLDIITVNSDELLYSEQLKLSEGLSYTRNIYNHQNYGNEYEYILEYFPSSDTALGFATNKYLYQTAELKDMAAYNYPDENFVAGINADFFNMSTGVPESAFIKDYEIYTTDRDSFCLALTDEGRYFFDKPQIKIVLRPETGYEISIAHLNKEFSEYGVYLYNSRYSETTHITRNYSSAVLLPYDDVRTAEELIDMMENEEIKSMYTSVSELSDENLINDFYKYLEEESGYTYINGKFYAICNVIPTIGNSEQLVVYSSDGDCKNSEIPQNAYLICADNTSYGYIPRDMKPGDTYELEITGNEVFHNVVNAIGVGDIIVNNGEVITSDRLSHYSSLQPRSAVGIKEDGTLIFYAVDGGRNKKSAGLKLADLAEKMKSFDCIYAANLDGGGSTAVNAFRPGTEGALTVNSPSNGSIRKISNGFIFTNNYEKSEFPYSAHVYSDSIITYSDWLIEIPEPVISDSNGFAYVVPEDSEPPEVSFFTKNDTSIIADGILYPSGAVGEIEVFSTVNGMLSENPAFSVFTINAPDTIKLTADKLEIAPFETVSLDVSAKYKKLDVISDHGSYVWSVKTADEEYASGLNGKVENGVFYPFTYGTEYTLTASRGDASDSINIYVYKYPFEDIENHWAVKEIYNLAKKGVVNGYPDDFTGLFYYLPQKNYSRYEFSVMLDRMTDIGDDITVPERTSDEAKTVLCTSDFDEIPDWAYESVYKLFVAGYLGEIMKSDDNGMAAFKGSDAIVRADVMNVLGRLCQEAPEDYEITAFSDITDTQIANTYIRNCLYNGIFSGYDDMTLKPYGLLSRAEAAAVFVRLDNLISEEK